MNNFCWLDLKDSVLKMLQAFLLYYEGKVKPKFLNQLDMMNANAHGNAIRTAECSSECSSNFLDSY